MANQAKLQSFRSRPIFQFGIQVPQSHKQAMELDAKNGNHLWRDSERQELEQIDEYEAFKDQGFKAAPPPGYKRIRVHMGHVAGTCPACGTRMVVTRDLSMTHS